jgi:translation initiation factor IF-3
MIRAREVRLIDQDGNQAGIIPLTEALSAADAVGLDLVEVAPGAAPPVCKIMDYGKFRYQQTKKLQEAKKKASTFQLKEIKVRPKTGDHDLEIKIGHIRRFLEDRDKVRVSMLFRGREIAFTSRAGVIFQRVKEATADLATVEQAPKMEGRIMVMILAPN